MQNSINLVTINPFPTLKRVGAEVVFHCGNDLAVAKVKLPNGISFVILQWLYPDGTVGDYSVTFDEYEYCQKAMSFSDTREVEDYVLRFLNRKLPT